MTVGQLQQRMSLRELLDWQRFEAMHQPLPDRLTDLHFGMLASTVVNIARSAESSPVQASDFLIIRERALPLPDDGESEVERQMRNWRGG